MILSDVQMPGESGLDLLKWAVSNHPNIPVIMTGFSELLDASTAANAGAVGFLPKPFKEEGLSQVLLEAISTQTEKEGEGNNQTSLKLKSNRPENEFLKVSVEEFIMGSQITVPIFVKVPSVKGDKYIKVAHCGEDLTSDRIGAYRAKGLKYFYLSRDDYMQYVGLNIKVTKAAANSSTISPEKKSEIGSSYHGTYGTKLL